MDLTDFGEEIPEGGGSTGGVRPVEVIHMVCHQIGKRGRRENARDGEISIHRDAQPTPSLTCGRGTEDHRQGVVVGQEISCGDLSHRKCTHDVEKEVTIGDHRRGEEDESCPLASGGRETAIVGLMER